MMKRGFLNSSKAQKTAFYPEAKVESSSQRVAKPSDGSLEANIPGRKTVATDSDIIDYSRGQIILTSIPPIRDPDGNTEWIAMASTKQKVVAEPGFPRPVPKVSGPPSYEIRSTPDMGLGCFAKRAMQAGDLIFAERPLVVTPRRIWLGSSDDMAEKYGEDQALKMAWAERERTLELAVGMLLDEDRKALMALTNSHKDSGVGPLHGIVRTNAYSISNLFDGPELLANEANAYNALVKIGSRINHSCRPNITYRFDIASFSLQFRAIRDIEAGEQLFYSYCDTDQPVARRQAELAKHYGGLACKCLSCVNATPESDKFRQEYWQRVMEIYSASSQWKLDPSPYLRRMLALYQGMIDEGLQKSMGFVYCLQTISAMYELLSPPSRRSSLMNMPSTIVSTSCQNFCSTKTLLNWRCAEKDRQKLFLRKTWVKEMRRCVMAKHAGK